MQFRCKKLHLFGQFLIGDRGDAAFLVLLIDPLLECQHQRIVLVDRVRAHQLQVLIHPDRNAGNARGITDHNLRRTIQQQAGIENIVDFFIFQESVRMNPGAGHVEFFADERGARRYMIAELLLVVFCDLRDDGRIHAV